MNLLGWKGGSRGISPVGSSQHFPSEKSSCSNFTIYKSRTVHLQNLFHGFSPSFWRCFAVSFVLGWLRFVCKKEKRLNLGALFDKLWRDFKRLWETFREIRETWRASQTVSALLGTHVENRNFSKKKLGTECSASIVYKAWCHNRLAARIQAYKQFIFRRIISSRNFKVF